jgi:hypothetical protein
MTDSIHLLLITADGRLPRRVVAGATTLPLLVTSSADAEALRVLVVRGAVPETVDADAVLLVDPTMAQGSEIAVPVAVVDRWAGSDTTSAFVEAYGTRLRAATFVHLRASVAADVDPPSVLLDVALLMERVVDGGLGTIRSSDISAHHGSFTAVASTGGGSRTTHVSIVCTDADTPHVRLDAHGDGEVSTLVVPDRDAGSAAGEAYAVTEHGYEGLPTRFSDPVRAALLRLVAALNGRQPVDDLARLRRAIASLTPAPAPRD